MNIAIENNELVIRIPVRKIQFETTEKKPIFTTRELQIFSLMSEGKNAKDIANDLGTEVTTSKQYISRVYKKLGVGSRKEFLRGWRRRHFGRRR